MNSKANLEIGMGKPIGLHQDKSGKNISIHRDTNSGNMKM